MLIEKTIIAAKKAKIFDKVVLSSDINLKIYVRNTKLILNVINLKINILLYQKPRFILSRN